MGNNILQPEKKRINSVKDALKIIWISDKENNPRYSLKSIWLDSDNEKPETRARYKYPFGVWFRGQSNAERKLTPWVFRTNEKEIEDITYDRSKGYIYDESSLYHHFVAQNPEHRAVCESDFDWLCLMKHYEAPTRLLDWTESILVALYFAVSSERNINNDGKLFALNGRRLNQLGFMSPKKTGGIYTSNSPQVVLRSIMADRQKITEIVRSFGRFKFSSGDIDEDTLTKNLINKSNAEWLEKIRYPVAVFPKRFNSRMISQFSMFTVHGGKKYVKNDIQVEIKNDDIPEPISLEELNNKYMKSNDDRRFLKCYLIPKESKYRIKRELELLGIREDVLFPELDHQAHYLEQLWKHDVK